MQDNASFITTLEQPSMIVRLTRELQEAGRELRENPRTYVTNAFKRDAAGSRRKNLLRVGLAIGVLVYAMGFAAILVLVAESQSHLCCRPRQSYSDDPSARFLAETRGASER